MTSEPEARRLERLWAGEFGDAYVRRNAVLEVGCGQGSNLRHLAAILSPESVWGVDVNAEARRRALHYSPGANVVAAVARALPFRDGIFDLAMTVGVLIHQPETTLPLVMAELVRVSRRYILWAEYHADETTELSYHGERGALLKRDFGGIYRELFPELVVRREGFLGEEAGFDRTTWQLLEKPGSGSSAPAAPV